MVFLDTKSQVWRGIWHADVPRKCKSVVWRACKEELPVKSLLQEKSILVDATCPCCGNGTETTAHALFMCEEIKRVWFASPLGLRVELLDEVKSLTQLIEQCVCVLDAKAMGIVCAILWALWHRRNVLIFDDIKLDCKQVMDKAWSMITREVWAPPPLHHIKGNFAAVARGSVGGIGMGVIFRNSLGETLASCTLLLEDEFSEPLIVDALCFKWAAAQSGELGFSNVEFETDCKMLHTRWNEITPEKNDGDDDDNDVSYLDSILEDCKIMIEGTGSSFLSAHPTANKVARSLAAAAFDYGEKVWMGVVPEEASMDLKSDMATLCAVK